MNNSSAPSWEDLRKNLVLLADALSEYRDSLILLSLALEDYQFEKDISSLCEAKHAAKCLIEGLMLRDDAKQPENLIRPRS